MGLFDLRCAISRVSTLWRPAAAGRMTCSMFLVERLGGAWVPWTPPVRGTYDRYGGIELWPEDVSGYTTWVGETLWSLWQSGALETSWPEDLKESRRAETSRVERMLKHGAETAYNAVKLTIEGREVGACEALDVFAAAIEAADPGRAKTVAEGLERLFPAGGAGRRWFAEAPAEALGQVARYASVWEYMRSRGGLAPIRSGETSQDSEEAIRKSVRRAWEREEGPIAATIARLEPKWVIGWRKGQVRREAEEAAISSLSEGEARAYSAGERFSSGELISHAKFGRGRVEAVEGGKIRVRFADGVRVLVHR